MIVLKISFQTFLEIFGVFSIFFELGTIKFQLRCPITYMASTDLKRQV